MSHKILKVGDVILLQDGMDVYTELPSKFIYDNRKLSTKLAKSGIVVGITIKTSIDITKEKTNVASDIVLAFKSNLGYDVSLDTVNYFIDSVVASPSATEEFIVEAGAFVVLDTKYDGGGSGDYSFSGHHVFCKRLKDGKYDANGQEVDFYQSGGFTAMIKPDEIQPIATMTVTKTVTLNVV